jgi:two-component system, OmpR family, sensor histidine kinase KdpD
MAKTYRSEAAHAVAALAGVAAITGAYLSRFHVVNTTVALSYLLLVLFVAASSQLWVAVTTSVAAALAFDFFFLPPVGTFVINNTQDWVAFLSFVTVSFVASRLSAVARTREKELGRLLDFSRDALLDTGNPDATASLADHLVARFGLAYAAICLRTDNGFDRHQAGTLPADALPSLADLDGLVSRPERLVWLAPLQRGARAVGVLVVGGRRIEPGTLNALSSVVTIAIERVHLLEQRERAETARRSVEIKSALLASLTHDVRTPLTAIGMAVDNLAVSSLTEVQRASQTAIALAGVARLNRLFQNMLEMARIDAGGITPSPEPVPLSEIVHVARRHVEYALGAHTIRILDHTNNQAAHVDPRLVSTALAHVLENAAQYSPPGSTITITLGLVSDGVRLVVDDEGPGIAAADVPHLFERFYRGREAQRRVSGTGMGLAIVQGLLTAQGGRAWVEERAEGGARVAMFVPDPSRTGVDE